MKGKDVLGFIVANEIRVGERERERERKECELEQWNGVVEIRNFEMRETEDGRRKGKNPRNAGGAVIAFISG
jgi:hypothetical protein